MHVHHQLHPRGEPHLAASALENLGLVLSRTHHKQEDKCHHLSLSSPQLPDKLKPGWQWEDHSFPLEVFNGVSVLGLRVLKAVSSESVAEPLQTK